MASIGIDFGTTYSSICLFMEDEPIIQEYNEDFKHIPTKISYHYDTANEKDCWLYGIEAERVENKATIIDIKRMLGISADLPNLQDIISEWKKLGIIIVPSIDDNCFPKGKIRIQFKRNLNNCFYMSPEKLAGGFIKYLVETVANVSITPTLKVVITIPANYSSNQRKATITAAKFAGFKEENVKLLHEPSAAALCYMMLKKNTFQFNNFLVCDFGGGTFDLSLLRISNSVFDVKRIGGNRFLGGRDFDRIFYEWVLHLYQTKNINIDEKLVHKNMIKCQKAKESFSFENNESILISFEGTSEEITLKRDEFEQRCKMPIWINKKQTPSLLDQIENSINEILNDENISKEQIEGVILVGGSSRILCYKKMMNNYFGSNKIFKFPKNKERESIAMGACYMAAINDKKIQSAINTANFNQRLSHSLGVEITEKRFKCVIPKNTLIPTQDHTALLETAKDNQIVVEFYIYECDESFTYNGELITECQFTNLLPKPKGYYKFNFIMKIDQNGILKVKSECPQMNLTINHEHDMEFKKVNNIKTLLNDDFNNQQAEPKNIKDCQKNKNARDEAKKTQLR